MKKQPIKKEVEKTYIPDPPVSKDHPELIDKLGEDLISRIETLVERVREIRSKMKLKDDLVSDLEILCQKLVSDPTEFDNSDPADELDRYIKAIEKQRAACILQATSLRTISGQLRKLHADIATIIDCGAVYLGAAGVEGDFNIMLADRLCTLRQYRIEAFRYACLETEQAYDNCENFIRNILEPAIEDGKKTLEAYNLSQESIENDHNEDIS